MTRAQIKLGLIVLAACTVTACGMEPSGGSDKSSSAASSSATQQTSGVSTKKEETKADTPKENSSDAVQAGVAVLPEELAAINTDAVAACHEEGSIYDRRTTRCSQTMRLASSFTCDKEGVRGAFKLTGYLIDEALKNADNDGFVLDQCGESESGRLIAYFVRLDDDGSHSIREIETKLK